MTPRGKALVDHFRAQILNGCKNGELTAKYADVEKACGVPYNQVRTILTELTDLGLLELTGSRPGTASTYRLKLPR